MTCRPDSEERTGAPPPSGPAMLPEPGATRLITERSDQARYTGRRDCDALRALCRGLAEYAGGLSLDVGGVLYSFRSVHDVWPEAEDVSAFPALVVYVPEPSCEYESRGTTPIVGWPSSKFDLPAGEHLVATSQLSADLRLEAWGQSPSERSAMVMALEDGLSPVEWMFGVRLELPHYHNVRADYELVRGGYVDSEADAVQRVRRAVFTLKASIPVIRRATIPGARPRVTVAVR